MCYIRDGFMVSEEIFLFLFLPREAEAYSSSLAASS